MTLGVPGGSKQEYPGDKRRKIIMVDDIARASLLYDFYGALLTDRQRDVMALYHEENLSLSEIAQEYDISRQAVHDTLKKAEQALSEYEKKLGLVDKLLIREKAINRIEKEIDSLEEAVRGTDHEKQIDDRLQNIKDIIESIED